MGRDSHAPTDRAEFYQYGDRQPPWLELLAYGSYIPYRRLRREAIAQVLGISAGRGERAVASFDEDCVSMAVEALRDALKSAPNSDIRAVFFASTTPPYAEKLNAALIGAAARLPGDIRAADLAGSIRAAISAMLQTADTAGGGHGPVAEATADARLGAPEGKAEQNNGDGAVGFVIGTEGVIAEIEASASATREFLDSWRLPGERFAHSWEERFALTQAYDPLFKKVLQEVMEKASLPLEKDDVRSLCDALGLRTSN